jgi:hypothetical protein
VQSAGSLEEIGLMRANKTTRILVWGSELAVVAYVAVAQLRHPHYDVPLIILAQFMLLVIATAIGLYRPIRVPRWLKIVMLGAVFASVLNLAVSDWRHLYGPELNPWLLLIVMACAVWLLQLLGIGTRLRRLFHLRTRS